MYVHLYLYLLTEAAVTSGMWHMLLTTSVAFDSLSEYNRLQSLHVRPLYLYLLSLLICLQSYHHGFLHSLISVFNMYILVRALLYAASASALLK